jgi:sugar lactone lactonase YvrE
MKLLKFLPVMTLFVFIIACSAQNPSEILIKSPGLYPEGIAYSSKTESFYVSSILQGKILKVDKNGNTTVFAENKQLISTLGIEIDEKRNRLIICNSDPGMGMKSSESTKGMLGEVIIYNLKTGKKIKTVNLSQLIKGPHLINDITLDKKGNIYATDSFSPAIYKINTQGEISILIQDSKFAPTPKSFGLNGLVYHPNGYLIVGKYNVGTLYKIPLNNPSSYEEIKIDKKVYPTIDGIKLLDNNNIALVSNNMMPHDVHPAVYKLTSSNNWKSAKITGTNANAGAFPTTLTKVNKDIYVINSNLQMLMGGNNPQAQEFKIMKVTF